MTRPARRLHVSVPVLVAGMLLASACGSAATRLAGGDAHQSTNVLEITPRMVSLPAGGSATFTARVAGSPVSGVQWSVSGGSITGDGVYTAPSQLDDYQVHASYDGLTAVASVNVVGPGSPASFHAAATSTCASMPLRTTGTVYHFCDCQAGAQGGCVAGADANYAAHGCSADYPCQTWRQASVVFGAMNGGDTIALCRGGAWAVTSTAPAGCNEVFSNPRCARGTSLTDPANTSTCDIRDYGASWGGTEKPLLAASTSDSTRILAHGGQALNGVRVMNLAFNGGNAGPNGGVYNDKRGIITGTCRDSTDSDWLICNNSFDRFYLAIDTAEGRYSRYNGFLIWGNTFTMNDLDAMLLGSGADNRIDANFFDNNGGFPHPVRGNQAHTVYLAGNQYGEFGSTNTSIVNNEFRRSAATGTVGPNTTGILVGHEMYDGVNVENNIVDAGVGAQGGNWAISFGSAKTCPTHYRNMTIRRNWVSAGGTGICVGQAPGVVIENNVITMVGTGTWKQGIVSPFDVALSGSAYGTSVGDDVENGAIIRNNTIYITGANNATNGIVVGTEGTGHAVANNAVYLVGSTGGRCFSTPLGAAAYSFVGNNACFGGVWGTSYDVTSHVTGDPRFAGAPTDFTPLQGSPLIGAGNAAYAPPTDFALQQRPAPPSIGAYEP